MDPFDKIRACHEAKQALPGLAYRDSEVYEAEVSELFKNTWISITCAQNLPHSGDLLPIRIAGHSLFASRDDDSRVRVFFNMCPHRGARLVDKACQAPSGKITCPYHAWSFGVDGKFKTAPHLHHGTDEAPSTPAEKEAEKERLGLLPVRSALWRDIVFVNLSGQAEPFEDFIRPLAERIARWTESELRPLCSDEYEIKANWKLAAENFLDAYHLPVLHAQMGMSYVGALTTEHLEVSEDIIGARMSYGEDMDQSDWVLPRFSGLGEEDQGMLELFSIFPNTLLIVEPDCAQVIVLRPQSAELTLETFANYVVSDASQVEAMAEEREEVRSSSVLVNDQDLVLLEGQQQARSMDVGGDTHPLAGWDATLQRFQSIWARKLLAKRP